MKDRYKVIEMKADFTGTGASAAIPMVERCIKKDLAQETARAMADKLNDKQALVTGEVFLSYVAVPERAPQAQAA